MCGVFGIVSFGGTFPTEAELARGGDLAAHRGPNDRGTYRDGQVGFAHRRLAILDLSADGRQPMALGDRLSITYNGEIYNYLEIRDELRGLGHRFRTGTDTEVILAAYAEWGPTCVRRFNGMWAFAIHDRMRNVVFCSRDRFGVKPFHFTRLPDRLVFASEIRQILPFLPSRRPDRALLEDYLALGVGDHPRRTFFEGVEKLPASHSMVIDPSNGTITPERHYAIGIVPEAGSLDAREAAAAVRRMLTSAVELRLRSDVRVGTCLSGGLDSSGIAAIAASHYAGASRRRFTAIHAKSIERKTDESEHARLVARHCGLDLEIIEPTLEQLDDLVEETILTQEEPFGGPSVLMQDCVMRRAREIGCTVLLDGQGGDETLFGYEAYFAPYFSRLLGQGHFGRFARELAALKCHKVPRWKVAVASVARAVPGGSRLESLVRGRTDPALGSPGAALEFRDFQIQEIEHRSLPLLLRYEDRNSMRHAIETRLPFLDWRMVELSLSIDDRLKFQAGFLKYILRLALEDLLPESIVWRPNKFGFEAPTDIWMERARPRMLAEIRSSRLLDSIGRPERSGTVPLDRHRLWRLYNAAAWGRLQRIECDG